MIDRIKKHIEERDSIIEELKTIMVYCNDSPIRLDFYLKNGQLWVMNYIFKLMIVI